VERFWETLQSRLLVELRVARISTPEEANAFLPGFIERFNARFAVEAADPEPAYMPVPTQDTIETILCVNEHQTAFNGSVISMGKRTGLWIANTVFYRYPLEPRWRSFFTWMVQKKHLTRLNDINSRPSQIRGAYAEFR